MRSEARIPVKGCPGLRHKREHKAGSFLECQKLGFDNLSSLALNGNHFIWEQEDGGISGGPCPSNEGFILDSGLTTEWLLSYLFPSERQAASAGCRRGSCKKVPRTGPGMWTGTAEGAGAGTVAAAEAERTASEKKRGRSH